MQLEFPKNAMSKTQLLASVGLFWQRSYKIILLFFLLAMSLLSGYVWHTSLSGGQWSDEKKQAYMAAQNSGVVFNENNFNKALSAIEDRKKFNSENKEIKDIFKTY